MNDERLKILIVDDEHSEHIRPAFDRDDVRVADNLQDARAEMAKFKPDGVVLDVRFPDRRGGQPRDDAALKFLEHLESLGTSPPFVILATQHDDVADEFAQIERFLDRGTVADIMLKRVGWKLFQRVLRAKFGDLRRQKAQQPSSSQIDELLRSEIIGASPVMREVAEKLFKAALYKSPVLIRGESGTGKELAARAIHRLSARHHKELITRNSASLSGDKADSELFGHKKGAFTGATEDRNGAFLSADGSTLFIDEIGDLPMEVQVKILRVLEDQKVRAVGSDRETQVDVRLITATNRNLEEMIQRGTFRDDLFWRLDGIVVTMPPLRDRKEDIPLLAGNFLRKFAQDNRTSSPSLSPDAVACLQDYSWPGNVRQFGKFVERLCMAHPEVKELSATHVRKLLAAAGGGRTGSGEPVNGESDPLLLDELSRLWELASPPQNPRMFEEFRKIITENPALSDRRRDALLRYCNQVSSRPGPGDDPAAAHLLQLGLILIRRGRISKADYEDVCKQIPNGDKRMGKTKPQIKPAQIDKVIKTSQVLSPLLFQTDVGPNKRTEVLFAEDDDSPSGDAGSDFTI